MSATSTTTDKQLVLTANDLRSGVVVYFNGSDGWSGDFHAARIFASDQDAAPFLATAGSRAGQLVAPYLAEIVIDALGKTRPAHFREAMRADGPGDRQHDQDNTI